MLLTNHALAGVLLGVSIENPLLLAPTAFASHFVMDSVPHIGHPTMKSSNRAPMFLIVGSLDFISACTVTAIACYAWPSRSGHILLGAISAAAPDLLYIPDIAFGLKLFKTLTRFHTKIQWYERPPGLITEIVGASLFLYLLHARL